MSLSQQMCASGLHSFEDFNHELFPGPRCSKCGKWNLRKKNSIWTLFLEIGLGVLTISLVSMLLLNLVVTVYFLI